MKKVFKNRWNWLFIAILSTLEIFMVICGYDSIIEGIIYIIFQIFILWYIERTRDEWIEKHWTIK